MSEDNFVPDESNWIELPKEGRLNTEFIKDLIKEVSYTNELFFRPTLRQIVEIGKIKENEKYKSNGFLEVKPERFITLCEKYFVPGIRKFKFDNSNGQITDIVFKKKSISAQLSKIVLASEIFENSLPIIERIFTVPTPIIYEHPDVDGKILTFPKKGYDRRFNSWLPEDSPEIIDDKITMEMAKETIELIVNEFCFKNGEDKTNAIAAIITPFLKGLYPSFNCRMPLFVYMANRERAGKDYLAGITGLIYEGKSIEENPINSEDGKGNSKSNEEELRKKITSAILSGKKRFHSANNKGYINNAVFEAVLTNKYYTDRILGSNKETTHDNEIEFSLSGNMGISFTADLMNRSKFINLFLDIEDANKRKFNNPNLHKWILDNRNIILSSLYVLVKDWYKNDEKKGSIEFASFPEWASICGGIMENAGYNNPCEQQKSEFVIGGDTETQDMKRLFELCYEQFGNTKCTKEEMKILINNKWRNENDIFQTYDFNNKSDQTKFGNLVKKNVGRIYSNIKLEVQDINLRGSRQKFIFTMVTKSGNLGNNGNLDHSYEITQSTL